MLLMSHVLIYITDKQEEEKNTERLAMLISNLVFALEDSIPDLKRRWEHQGS